MGDKRKTAAGKAAEEAEKAAQKATRELLPVMLEGHKKKTEEAVEEVRKTLTDSLAQLTEQVSVILERLNDLEKNKENNPPPEGRPDKRGLYPTMKDVNEQLNGEIRMRMTA